MSTFNAKSIITKLKAHANPAYASHAQGYFKTGKGEYGEGDTFLGIRMPVLRILVKELRGTSLSEIEKVLHSLFHEARILAALLLVDLYQQGNHSEKALVFTCYLKNTQYINNWDIVDCSAHLIVGPHLEHKSHQRLYKLAQSKALWERRIAIMSTFHFIRQKEYSTALDIIEILLNDNEDLIHKASGWMLREVGNRDRVIEEAFLKKYYKTMPRTMLRYAIEKFPEPLRKSYLKGEIISVNNKALRFSTC